MVVKDQNASANSWTQSSELKAGVADERPMLGSDLGTETLSDVLPVVEEHPYVSKRRVKTGSVRVSTHTETHEEVAELFHDRTAVEVVRVPVNRIIEEAPEVRTEGDTTVIPVLQERLVVVKQLVLIEELHIRRQTEHQVHRTPVALRRQRVSVERLDADGRPLVPTPTDEDRTINLPESLVGTVAGSGGAAESSCQKAAFSRSLPIISDDSD